MKKLLPIVVSLIFAIHCTGCEANKYEFQTPVVFYYCAEQLDFTSDSSVIQSEERTVNCPSNDYEAIMQFYLKGPQKHGLYSPLPKNLTITEFLIEGETTYITFSTELSYLSGVDLTLACVCIANTCFDLTHTQNVDISAEHALLDNLPSISINYSNTSISDIR